MKSTVLVAGAFLAMASALPEWSSGRLARAVKGTQLPKADATLNQQTSQGCFRSSGTLKLIGTPDYNSIGKCAKDNCLAKGFAVGATSGGNQCWCGNEYPPEVTLVDDKFCDVGCTGFGEQACGGIRYWSVYNTGATLIVDNSDPKPEDLVASSSSSASATPTPTRSPSNNNNIQAPPSEQPVEENAGSKSNTAGIAAGVVVGVVVVAAAVGGFMFYLRRKRNQEIEDEHRRNASVNAFVGKPPRSSDGMSMTDARLDPVMAQRRMSDGSIADNQDYSRKILRVTNA